MQASTGLKGSARFKLAGTAAAVILAGATMASTANAQERVRWQVPIAFPSHLVGLSTPVVHLSETLEAISGGNINLR
ncbi:C4-dicarboxylate ABC transporter, partial [Halomonas sp. A29]